MNRSSGSVRVTATLLLAAALGHAGCREVDPTQLLVEITADSLARARGRYLQVTIWSSDGALAFENGVALTGEAPAIELPTVVPIVPAGGDSKRTFRLVAELRDGDGRTFNRYEGLGAFVEHRIVERRVVLTDPCNDIVCDSGQSCFEGACAAVASLPEPPTAVAPAKEVGPGRAYSTPCAALTAAQDGDTILIYSATYAGEACVIERSGLQIRGVGPKPLIDAAGARAEGKALWLLRGSNTVIENLELRNATGDSGVGAALRLEARNLTLRDVLLADSQTGLRVMDDPGSEVLVERTELRGNGTVNGNGHNLYVGRVKRFTLRDSWSHDGIGGHLVRSQAADNFIEQNRLTGENGTASYQLDFPTGGRALVLGNVLQQGNATDNRVLLTYGEEGGLGGNAADHYLYVSHNTFVSRRGAGALFVRVSSGMQGEVRLVNNVFDGNGTVVDAPIVTQLGECTEPGPFVDEASYDFTLAPGSPCIDMGVAAGTAAGYSLTPTRQYVHPLGSRPRVPVRAPDPGAFESP